jgi:hypothetical protein
MEGGGGARSHHMEEKGGGARQAGNDAPKPVGAGGAWTGEAVRGPLTHGQSVGF